MTRPPPFASKDMILVRRNPWVLVLALSPLVFSAIGIAAALPAQAVNFALSMAWIPSLVWARNPWPLSRRVAVCADMEGVRIGARKIPRARIREGFIVPRRPYRLVLRCRFAPRVELELGSADDGRALLRALGLDATQTVATFGDRLHVGLVLSACAMALIYMVTAGLAANIVVALGLFVVLAPLLTLARLTVGIDGVVRSRLGRKRFIGYGDIDTVRYEERWWGWRTGVLLTLRSGEMVRFPMAQLDKETGAIIEERIWEAMAVHAGGDGADAALLRKGTRTVGQWIASLRAIGAGANADLRTAPLPRERLLRIVEDPASPADDRAAAAVAVGASSNDDDRARLQSVADAVAAPRLRVAIEAAAGADDAELEAALAQVVEEMTKQRALARR